MTALMERPVAADPELDHRFPTSTTDLVDGLVERRRDIARLEAECARRVAKLIRRNAHEDLGYLAPLSLLVHRLGVSAGVARGMIRISLGGGQPLPLPLINVGAIQRRRHDSAIPRSAAICEIGFDLSGPTPPPDGGTRRETVQASGPPLWGPQAHTLRVRRTWGNPSSVTQPDRTADAADRESLVVGECLKGGPVHDTAPCRPVVVVQSQQLGSLGRRPRWQVRQDSS